MPTRFCSKSSKLGFSSTWTQNFQMYKLVLEKAEKPEIKLPTDTGSWKNKGTPKKKKNYFCSIDYTKAFDCVNHNKLWKIIKEMGIPHHLICSLRSLYAGQEAKVRTRHGTMDWFQIGKSESEVAQLCLIFCDPMDCSLSGSSVHGIFQARVLEWIAISFSRGSSQPRNRTQVSRIAGRCFTIWATREAPNWERSTPRLYIVTLHI